MSTEQRNAGHEDGTVTETDSAAAADPALLQPRSARVKTLVVCGAAMAAVVALVAVIVVSTSTMTMRGTITGEKPRTVTSVNDVCKLDMSSLKGYLPQRMLPVIGQGSAVTVYNAMGVPIAAGRLDAGLATPSSECVYSFVVEDIPTGEDQYGITIGELQMMYLSPDAAREPRLCIQRSRTGPGSCW